MSGLERIVPDEYPKSIAIAVVMVTFRRGTGDSEADPIRFVRRFFTPEGTLLGEDDPFLSQLHRGQKEPHAS